MVHYYRLGNHGAAKIVTRHVCCALPHYLCEHWSRGSGVGLRNHHIKDGLGHVSLRRVVVEVRGASSPVVFLEQVHWAHSSVISPHLVKLSNHTLNTYLFLF